MTFPGWPHKPDGAAARGSRVKGEGFPCQICRGSTTPRVSTAPDFAFRASRPDAKGHLGVSEAAAQLGRPKPAIKGGRRLAAKPSSGGLRYSEPGRELAEFVTATAGGCDGEHGLADHRMMPGLLRGDLPCALQGAQAAGLIAG